MLLPIVVAVSVALGASVGNAQSVVLRLDSNPENRCEKVKQGAMWKLLNPPAPTNGQPNVTVVSLLRSDSSGNPSRTVSYTLSSGQTIELECSQGTPTVSYQIVDQR